MIYSPRTDKDEFAYRNDQGIEPCWDHISNADNLRDQQEKVKRQKDIHFSPA